MKTLVVVPDRCVGCERCKLYCSFRFYRTHNPSRSRIQVIRSEPYIDAPIVCLQCGLCMSACPRDAMSRNAKTGAIVVDQKKCGGCGLCVPSCPIGMMRIDPVTHVAIKCDLCGGEPECAKKCPEGALQYIDAEKAAYYRRKTFAKLFKKEAVPLKPFPS